MSSTSSLGPLETLLLLRGLQASDPATAPFEVVSESLKARDASFLDGPANIERFQPKSLELLYLRLLKEEAKLESKQYDRSTHDQDDELNARKRKLSSPPVESMEEAWHYRHLIPQLATRVYESHKESAIKAIEDEERKYQDLKKDIQDIERGEWDAHFQSQESTSKKDSKSISSIQTLLQDEPDPPNNTSNIVNGPPLFPVPRPYGKDVLQSLRPDGSVIENQPHTVPFANGDAGPAVPNATGSIVQNTVTPATASPKRPRQPLYAPPQVPSNTPGPPSQPTSTENGVSSFPPPPYPNQGFGITSSPPDIHRRPASQSGNIVPSPSTRPHQTPRQPPERSSGSPIILPPPPGMLRSNSSASGPLDSIADLSGNHYRPNALPTPRPPHVSRGSQYSPQLPLPPIHAHDPYQHPHYDTRHSYPNVYPPYQSGTSAHYQRQNHSHFGAYQPSTHHPGQQSQYNPRPSHQSPILAYPQYSPYGSAAPYTPQHGQMASPYHTYPPARPIVPQTPVYASGSLRKAKPSPINTSVSSTKWKNIERSDEHGSRRSPERPGSEEISPISEKAPSPVLEPTTSHSKTNNAQEDLLSLTKDGLPAPLDQSSTVKRGRGRPRGAANRGRGGRTASIASSALPTRSRSPSLGSGADELSFGAPISAGPRSAIKPEPPATPARDSSASIPPTIPTDDGNRKSTRRRRGTLRGIEATAESTRATTKRKRTIDTPELDNRPMVRSELEKQREKLSATHILASRNFPRTSATLMNDISAHKLASIFAKPLTEREAPGYPSLIYQSQDFKSIKQAITVGNRALTAFVEQERDDDGDENHDVIPVAGAGEGDARIWVKKNEDFMPPKGIVNSAQLEKEIMRVFANAVMFNPDTHRALGPAYRTRAKVKERHVPVHLDEHADEDEDENEEGDDVSEGEGGVVKDAREMFEDVERVVGQWRAAERAAEDAAILTGTGKVGRVRGGGVDEEADEADELAGDESGVFVEEESGGERPGKRRRR
ncbi:MAG: hypothetical protein Q9209_002436 [Squamulea sp. 1 TL-2023]